MNLFRKSALSFAGVAAAALLLALASPRTVQAFSAALIRIANTAEEPAIVEDVPHFASHLVTLTGSFDGAQNTYPYFSPLGPDSKVLNGDFVVPAGQSFVITSVEILPYGNPSAWVRLYNYDVAYLQYGYWFTPNSAGTTELQFPSGIVVGSGINLALNSSGAFVTVHGYLTPN
jgi:hypothetical protein